MKITYSNGNINVYVNNTFYLNGFYQTNYLGYLGFTASTGNLTDNHSIKNVTIYTSMPISDAGKDQALCSGDTVKLGAANNPNYNYSWTPTTGLPNPSVSAPLFSLTNLTANPVTYTFILTTDTANTGCSSTDTVQITVKPKPHVYLGKDTTICDGSSINLNAGKGFMSYLWSTKETSRIITVTQPNVYWVKVTELSIPVSAMTPLL